MIVKTTDVFDKWLRKIRDTSAQMTIVRRIRRIEQEDFFGDTKFVGDGVSEIRIFVGTGYRLYFTRRGNEIVILLCGGIKTGQNKAQQDDIKLAKELAKGV
jgi:putative addiction module killer protein